MKIIILLSLIVHILTRNMVCTDVLCTTICHKQHFKLSDDKVVSCNVGSCNANNSLCYCRYIQGNSFNTCNNENFPPKRRLRKH